MNNDFESTRGAETNPAPAENPDNSNINPGSADFQPPPEGFDGARAGGCEPRFQGGFQPVGSAAPQGAYYGAAGNAAGNYSAPFSVYNDPYYGKKLLERRELRRVTRTAVIPALILMAAFSYFTRFLVDILLAAGVKRESIVSLFSDPAFSNVYSVAISCLFFSVPFILAAKVSGFYISDLTAYGKSEKGTAFPMFLVGVAFCGFANIMSGIAGNFFSSLGFNYSVPDSDVPQGIAGIAVSVLAVSVEPALMEEFAMRGITYGLFRRWGNGFAIIVSSALFGLMHGNFEQIPFAFLVGLALGVSRAKTGSMWVGCAIHAFNNLIAVAFDYLPSSINLNLAYGIYLMLCILLGFLGLLLMKGDFFVIDSEPAETDLTAKERYGAVFSHPLTIIFAAMCVFESLMYWGPIADFINSLTA